MVQAACQDKSRSCTHNFRLDCSDVEGAAPGWQPDWKIAAKARHASLRPFTAPVQRHLDRSTRYPGPTCRHRHQIHCICHMALGVCSSSSMIACCTWRPINMLEIQLPCTKGHCWQYLCLVQCSESAISHTLPLSAPTLTFSCTLVCRPTNYHKDIEKSSPGRSSKADIHQAQV